MEEGGVDAGEVAWVYEQVLPGQQGRRGRDAEPVEQAETE